MAKAWVHILSSIPNMEVVLSAEEGRYLVVENRGAR
jgi:hypothetical protein